MKASTDIWAGVTCSKCGEFRGIQCAIGDVARCPTCKEPLIFPTLSSRDVGVKVGFREDCYINVGHRRTMLMAQGPFECDLCDEKALVVCIMPPLPLGHLNICQKCLQHISDILQQAMEEGG